METKLSFKSFFNNKKAQIITILFAILISLMSFAVLRSLSDQTITQKKANSLYTSDKIEKVILDGEYIYLETTEGNYKVFKDAINKNSFYTKYPVEVKQSDSYILYTLSLIFTFGLFSFLFRLLRQNKLQQLRQVRAEKVEDSQGYEPVQSLKSNVRFSDVAGIKDVKEELEEIIDFLREPRKYRDMNIRLPRGVLLVGPPGVGKTFISKAVAGEADVPFFYQSGASFVHIYVGMGAKRVSELFKKAKQMAPSIIFIDEIDAVGKSRGEFRNDEREATLNQLLTEMDGFEESSGVIVIGATNKIDVLDEALLRAGRFDRRIHISLPDIDDRKKTLELYLAHKPNSVNIDTVSRMTVGFNSAALDTLTNEAAIFAMREGRSSVKTSDFDAVREKVLSGKRKILSFTEEERKIQAIYQAGKAVIASWLDVEFDKIGIVNTRLLIQEHEILSKSKLLNRIKVYLAGSLATQIYYNEQFTNAKEDIHLAKELAHKVIYDYSMSDNFVVTPYQEEELLKESVAEAKALLKTLDKAITDVSDYLLVHENITQDECKEILREIF